MIPLDKLEGFVRRHEELEELLCAPEVFSSPDRLQELNRERSRLDPLVAAFRQWQTARKRIAEDREALEDPELGPLVREELPRLEAELTELEQRIRILLLPADPN